MRKTKKSRRRSQAESAALKAAGLNEEAAAEAAEWESLACDCERRLADERARNALLEAELARARAAAGADCAKAGRARPKAAVDLPLPTPPWTTTSGRLRRCRVVSPSSGVTGVCPWAIRRRSFGGWCGR